MTGNEQHRSGAILAGRYQLQESLGGGGIGQVYRAWDVEQQRFVAVKVFGASSCSPDTLQRYAKVLAAAGRVGHPGLVLPKGLGLASKDPPLVVFDALVGEEAGKLRARLGRVPWARALDLVAQAAEILHAVCSRTKVPHRDLKPSNIFVTERGEVRIFDYGIAEFDVQAKENTRVDTVLGVVDYKAPEQLDGMALGEFTDVFSLGVVLFELVTGVLPFRGASYYETARAILMAEAPRIAVAAPGLSVPLTVEALIRRALAKRPEDRFLDLQAMTEAIAQVRCSPGAAQVLAKTPAGTLIEADEDPVTLRLQRVGRRREGSALTEPGPEVLEEFGPGENTLVTEIGSTTGAGRGSLSGPRGTLVDDAGSTLRMARAARQERGESTMILSDGAGQGRGESTMILSDGARQERGESTMILSDAGRQERGESTMILPDAGRQERGESTMILPDAARQERGESTMILPDAARQERGESTMILPDAARQVRVADTARAPGQIKEKPRADQSLIERPLQRTLIMVNVACGLLILIGLLVMLVFR